MPRPIPRPTDKPVQPKDESRLDSLVKGYLRTAPAVAQTQAMYSPFNPVPSITRAGVEGRRPTGGEVGMDAAFAAVGMLPLGKAARPAVDNAAFVRAIQEYLQRPLTAYLPTQNPAVLQQGFARTAERIPAGTMMYRAPSAGQVVSKRGSQSVPLPREAGATYLPGRVQSTGGATDLQRIGGIGLSREWDTGGGQAYAPGMIAIEAMEDLPGIYNLNDYLSKYGISDRSNFITESVLGPQVRYVVRDFDPAGAQGFPAWYLNAYAR